MMFYVSDHPKIQQFVRDIDNVYVKIWNQFQTRQPHEPTPSETFPSSRFLSLFHRCHVRLMTELDHRWHDPNQIPFPSAISLHEFMNGVECKVSIPKHMYASVIPYNSDEMQPLLTKIVCWYWFRCETSRVPFQLEWCDTTKPWYGKMVWSRPAEYSWFVTERRKGGVHIMEFYKLMQYFFADAFRHRHKNGKVQWFLQQSKLDECLDLFTPMHARLPIDLVSSALEKYLITDLAKLCIGYL